MKDRLTTYERRTSILSYLRYRHTATMQELADEYGVSVLTVHRDICFLSRVAPITTKCGRSGGVSFVSDVETQRQYLTRDEEECLKELLDAVQGINRIRLQTIIYKFSLPEPRDTGSV